MRNAIGGLFDVFEPTYLQAAFQKRGSSPNLSHLVFGPIEWRIHGGPLPKAPDPLTIAFRELGRQCYPVLRCILIHGKGHPPDGPTNLELSRYRSRRLLSADEMTEAHLSCPLYEGPDSAISLWSVTPHIPLSYRSKQTPMHKFAHHSFKSRSVLTSTLGGRTYTLSMKLKHVSENTLSSAPEVISSGPWSTAAWAHLHDLTPAHTSRKFYYCRQATPNQIRLQSTRPAHPSKTFDTGRVHADQVAGTKPCTRDFFSKSRHWQTQSY